MPVLAIFNNGAPAVRKPDENYLETEKRRRYQHDTAIYHRKAAKLMRQIKAGKVEDPTGSLHVSSSLSYYWRLMLVEPSWLAIAKKFREKTTAQQARRYFRQRIAEILREISERKNPPTPLDPKTRRTWRR